MKTSRAALLVAAFLAVGLSRPLVSSAAPPPSLGAPAPQFALPIIANGHGYLRLSALRGHPVYLNFFASWCKPCIDEGNILRTLSGEFKRRGVTTVGVATLDTIGGAKGFVRKYGLSYPVVFDATGAVGGSYGLAQLPLQVFITADGKIALWGDAEMTRASGRDALRRLGRGN